MVEQDTEDQPMMTEADRGESETPEEEGIAGVLDSDGALEILPVSDGQEETDRAWYVVHCYSGYENKVRHNLEQRRIGKRIKRARGVELPPFYQKAMGRGDEGEPPSHDIAALVHLKIG